MKFLCQVTPISISHRVLHIIISSNCFASWIISVVYNSSHFHSQCSLWKELSKMSPLNIPWLIVGDFNSIVTHEEPKGGSFSYYSHKAHFPLKFIEENNLLDLNFSGPYFTWCNNLLGLAHRWAHLEMCLVNLE